MVTIHTQEGLEIIARFLGRSTLWGLEIPRKKMQDLERTEPELWHTLKEFVAKPINYYEDGEDGFRASDIQSLARSMGVDQAWKQQMNEMYQAELKRRDED